MDLVSRGGKYTMKDLAEKVEFFYKEWNMLSACDLVYNHIANESAFLRQSPNATFNMQNTPHLIPAFVLDRVFYQVSVDVEKGAYENQGVSREGIESHNIETLRHIMRSQEIPKYNLIEFFMIDLNRTMETIKEIGLIALADIEQNMEQYKDKPKCAHEIKEIEWQKLVIMQDSQYRRLMSSVDLKLVAHILNLEFTNLDFGSDLKNSDYNSRHLVSIYERFFNVLSHKNEEIRRKIEGFLDEAVNNVVANFVYHFIDSKGPRWSKVTKQTPLAPAYFYFPFTNEPVKASEKRAFDPNDSLRIQAHNGWVMNDNPLRNFASKESTVYLQRHLMPWGDSVKLRYGDRPEDSPELWEYMSQYTISVARIFHGIRLDNCHSTPIHVAQYFLDLARTIRPDLYVVAELFTNDAQTDNKFITELGITSLIRESLNAWDANELGRLVHRFGGEPVAA